MALGLSAAVQKVRDLSIARKLLLTVLVTLTVSLVLSGLGILTADAQLFRSYLHRDFSALGQIVADNSTATLAFNDPESATQTLAALKARPHLILACIYRPNGQLFASYSRQDTTQRCPSLSSELSASSVANEVTIDKPIVLSAKPIGQLVLRYDLNEIATRRSVYGLMVAGVLLASSIIAVLLSSRLRKLIIVPIKQLVDVTTTVTHSGDYSLRAEKHSRDELGMLADRFNDMMDAVQSRQEHLANALKDREAALKEAETAREHFRFMAESMPQKIFTANAAGEIDYFNIQWKEFNGVETSQSRTWTWTSFLHVADVDEIQEAWQRSLATGESFQREQRFLLSDGTVRWHLTRIEPLRGPDGNISMWIGSSTDIHEQKVREAELRRANDDLQQFAYSASHDLQEPIRNVTIFSDMLARRYGASLDGEGAQFLGFLTESGNRLASLVDDLLAYTRAGADTGPGTADAQVVLEQTLAALAESIRKSGAVVTSEPLPVVAVGATHLQQLFQNLIGNAIKYRGSQPPKIAISATIQSAAWKFAIRDNGMGIDPQFKESIFGVFKRLHRDAQYDGTGIGLAICQRVVERYGGRIWVESEPGQGSVFYFTIPKPTQVSTPTPPLAAG